MGSFSFGFRGALFCFVSRLTCPMTASPTSPMSACAPISFRLVSAPLEAALVSTTCSSCVGPTDPSPLWVEAVACLEGVDPTDAWGSPGFEPGRDSDRTGTPPTKTPVRPVGSRSIVLGLRPRGRSPGRTLGCAGFRKGGSEGYEPVLDRVRSPSPPSDSWKDTRDRIPTPVVGLDRPRLTSCLFRRGGSHGTHRTTRWTGPLDAFLHKPHPSIRFPFHSRFPRRFHRLPPL